MAANQENNCLGWAARDESGFLSPYKFARRSIGSDDVSVRIMYCGMCYADVIWTRNKHGDAKYPVVPGHEIVGVVEEVGSDVDRFKAGDHVGVGTFVDSCRECEYCESRAENICTKKVSTFNGVDFDGSITKGGYSNFIVVHQRYCYQIPENYPLKLAAPLLCAGITVYTPMKRHGMMNQPGKSLGVIGIGGLGHMAVKFGKAFGLHVTVFSTSLSKRDEALSVLGADQFVLSSDQEQMKAKRSSLDFIIDTASGDHLFDPYILLLKVAGVFVIVGAPSEAKINPVNLLLGLKMIAGSNTGGTKDTQEMLEFCAARKVYPNVEVVPIQYANEALERMINKDVKYRFVIDIENSLN